MPPTTASPVTTPPAEHSAERYRGIYTQSYNEIVQPGRVWTASKYFLRRWSCYLTPAEMWLVIGARQLSYLNRRRPWFAAYDSTLAAAAGLNVDVYRRTLKRAVAEQEGHIAHFLSKDADPTYVVRDDVPRKGRTRYTIRLDDPLTPADADAFVAWLQEHLPPDATATQVAQCLRAACKLEPQTLWDDGRLTAGQLGPTDDKATKLPLNVIDIVRNIFPELESDGDADKEWQTAADALHVHLVAAEIVHLEPHYFREQWLPALGPGPALLIVTLRSLCYFNEETGEIRDVVNTEANELAQRLQTTTRTLRRWFKKVEKAAAHDRFFGPFFTFLESNKQPDQKVINTYRVNMKMPLTRTDFARYKEQTTAAELTSNGLADKKSVTSGNGSPGKRQKVPDKKSATLSRGAPVPDKKSVTENGVADKTSDTPRRAGQKVGQAPGGAGQNVALSQTNRRPFKYYEPLLTALDLETLSELEQSTEQQYQHLWHIRDETAREPLADVAADGSLASLLDRMGIHEPARSRILQNAPPLEALMAWYLYATRQSNLDQPVGYVVARVLADDAPPEPFLTLASLSWEQWRAYALVNDLAARRLLPPDSLLDNFFELPAFQTWAELYDRVPPDSLPFDVGAGLTLFRIVHDEESDRQAAPEGPAAPSQLHDITTPTQKSDAALGSEATLWQETLAELSQQMAKATFDAWLRDSRLIDRKEDTWTIAVTTPAAKEWLENRLRRIIEQTLSVVVGEACSVRFSVGQGSDVK